jgi:hypothetical protein
VLEVKQGSHIVCISKDHGELNQLWDFEEDETIRNKLGFVLDVGEGRPKIGSPVVVYTEKGVWFPKFRIVPVSG